MKNLKLYIAILSVFLLMLIGIITIVNYTQKIIEQQEEAKQVGDISKDISTEMQKVDNYTTYNSIEVMMQNFYKYANKQDQIALFSLIDKQYAKNNNIEKENIVSKLDLNIDNDIEVKIKEIYQKQNLTFATYFIKISNIKNLNKTWHYIFYMDNPNGAFSIEPISENEYNSYTQSSETYELKEKTIEKNDYNMILRRSLNENEIVKRYFDDYLEKSLYDVEKAYNSLDEEYSQKRFGNIEEYKKYLNIKKEQLISMDENNIKSREDFATEEEYGEYVNDLNGLEKYTVIRNGEYTQYICIDSYGNYYIFNPTACFVYTVILDTYTVDIEEFTKRYNDLTENEKVLRNIQKLISATKDEDYKYVYNKLDVNFKATNFPTQQAFEKYIKEKYNRNDKLGFSTYEMIGNTHIYEIESTRSDGSKVKSQVLMQLNGEADFVVSFNIEK